MLSQEAAREEGQGDGGKAEILRCTTSGVQRHSVERERTPVKQQVHDRYVKYLIIYKNFLSVLLMLIQ
jgi:hypothetical protein